MNEHQQDTARACLDAAENGTMAFPQIVERLMQAGFESYAIDFRRAAASYYLPDGDWLELPLQPVATRVSPAFDITLMQAAIADAQAGAPGYTYEGFCERAAAAGCAGYMVSFSGRRALYLARTGETHTEHFPGK